MQFIRSVFPARAGMSPRPTTSQSTPVGFPRPRGDEPDRLAR